jgi:hypothetical protein
VLLCSPSLFTFSLSEVTALQQPIMELQQPIMELQQPITALQQPITAFYPTSPIQTGARPKEALQTDRRTETPRLDETLSAAETVRK